MSFAIEVNDITKRFRLYHEKYTSLKERAIHMGHIPYEDFWALRDINMEIKEGETVGLLGHNGSGKSTLLKLIAGILQPTQGEIRTVGRLAALLELGAGFHPDLSGRENIFLNASVLGMSKRDIAKRFDEIVAFAELEQFIDNSVKYYSSGMYVRLGFAVAVNMDPDILLVDEVLAVGDELFQRKCLDRIKQFQREGRTIVFVTHAADLVRQICDRATVLDKGNQVIELVPPGEAVRSFREHLLQRQRYIEAEQLAAGDDPLDGEPSAAEAAAAFAAGVTLDVPGPVTPEDKKTNQVRIVDVQITYPRSQLQPYLLPGDRLDVAVTYETASSIDQVDFGIAIYDMEGRVIYGSNTGMLDARVDVRPGRGEVKFSFPSVPLLDGTYPFTLGIHSADGSTVYDWREQQYQFEVMSPSRTAGLVDLGAQIHVEVAPENGQRAS